LALSMATVFVVCLRVCYQPGPASGVIARAGEVHGH